MSGAGACSGLSSWLADATFLLCLHAAESKLSGVSSSEGTNPIMKFPLSVPSKGPTSTTVHWVLGPHSVRLRRTPTVCPSQTRL